jgi:hypothetical protein
VNANGKEQLPHVSGTTRKQVLHVGIETEMLVWRVGVPVSCCEDWTEYGRAASERTRCGVNGMYHVSFPLSKETHLITLRNTTG